MASNTSILAWKIPWTEEPDGLQYMGLQRDTTEQLTHQQQGYFDKLPETGWLKTADTYPLTVLEARSSTARCWRGWLFLESWRRISSILFS